MTTVSLSQPAPTVSGSATTLGRRALRANAAFSAVSGAVCVVGAGPLGRFLTVDAWLTVAVGLGLLGYAAVLVRAVRSVRAVDLFAFAAMDGGWVLGTIVLLVGFPSAVSGGGRALLAGLAVVVGGFEVVQAVAGLRVRRAR